MLVPSAPRGIGSKSKIRGAPPHPIILVTAAPITLPESASASQSVAKKANHRAVELAGRHDPARSDASPIAGIAICWRLSIRQFGF